MESPFSKTFFLTKLCYILILVFNYTMMKMTYLSWPPLNMNTIREVGDSLGTDSLTMFVRNQWATGGLPANSTLVKGGITSIPLFACNIANDTYGWL